MAEILGFLAGIGMLALIGELIVVFLRQMGWISRGTVRLLGRSAGMVCGAGALYLGTAIIFELAVYGCVSGWLRRKLPKTIPMIYTVLVIAMIVGRVVWGIVRLILAGLSGSSFTWALFLAGAVTKAIPGIILHIVLIPILVAAMERVGLSLNRDE